MNKAILALRTKGDFSANSHTNLHEIQSVSVRAECRTRLPAVPLVVYTRQLAIQRPAQLCVFAEGDTPDVQNCTVPQQAPILATQQERLPNLTVLVSMLTASHRLED
jgi:hypothetical protein